jgi:hypothetical protein
VDFLLISGCGWDEISRIGQEEVERNLSKLDDMERKGKKEHTFFAINEGMYSIII